MGAARKLQGEIDRCLKKVQEGIDEFDQIWQKVHDTENANQKEKFEADLKKEIKKLQRLRDQIKSWISGADIKDKSGLLDARKAIEREMERFKTCEKEAKMKQFSKAALGQADRLDPREQAKMESREWINDMVDKLNVRIEQFEYEMEELQAGLKKKAKPPPKLVQLEEVVTVHKKHTSALEKALRCLDNDAITSEEIDPLKDDLDYYIAMDLDEHYDNTDDMYCEIADRLEAVEAAAPAASTIGAIATHTSAKAKEGKAKGSGGGKDDEEIAKEKERERERAAAAAVKAQLIAQGNSSVKLPEDDDRPKPNLPTPRPPALVSMGSGSIPPLSPIGTTPPAAAAAGGGVLSPPAVVPPSPKAATTGQPTPRSSIEVPPSPAVQARATPTAAESPADSSSTAATQNGPTAVSPVTPPPPAAAAAAAPATPSAGATPASRPGITLASVVSSGLREQQQQQQESPAQPTAVQQQQQQQVPAAAPATAAAAATPAGGRLGAWMAGVPESAKQAAAAQQQQQQTPTAAAVLQKGLTPAAAAPAAAAAAGPQAAAMPAGSKPGTPAVAVPLQTQQQQQVPPAQQQQGAPQQQQQQQQQQQAAASPDKAAAAADAAVPTAAAQNGPLVPPAAPAAPAQSAAADLAAAAAAAGVSPAVLDGVSGVALLEGWSRMAAVELGLGTAMHSQVPRGMMALPVLEACMRSALPQPSDSDWNKPKPRHPIVGPASYPKTQPDVISAPGLFRKMDPEALFFAFYYQPDTYQQYLAAQELKRQSWRYHKHHNAWFQRYAEPTVTSEEYEQGTYVYFDYNIMHDDLQTGWCYRRKENFTFRYDALEDELPVQAV